MERQVRLLPGCKSCIRSQQARGCWGEWGPNTTRHTNIQYNCVVQGGGQNKSLPTSDHVNPAIQDVLIMDTMLLRQPGPHKQVLLMSRPRAAECTWLLAVPVVRLSNLGGHGKLVGLVQAHRQH